MKISRMSGETCTLSGQYQCALHPSMIIFFHIGDVFPTCNKGGKHVTTWMMLDVPIG